MGQRTTKQAVSLQGVGLHTGAAGMVELRPAPPDSGIHFTLIGDASASSIPASVDWVTDTQLATTLGKGAWSIRTVEHLLAAVYGLGLDNLEIAVAGPELPILDGTAQPWFDALSTAGIQDQPVPRTVLVVDAPVRIEQNGSVCEAGPGPGLMLDITIHFDHALVGEQQLVLCVDPATVAEEIGWARTFGFERDVQALRRMGLVAGGSLDNAVVFSEAGVLNPGGLRRPDEPVRHKAMDLLGDLALLGHRVRGRFTAHRPGHGRVIALVRALLADNKAWHLEQQLDAP